MIAAGGTAGHVVPAIAVADALRARGAQVRFVGTRERAEAELVPAAGYPINFLDVRGLDRRNPVKAARAALKSVSAVREAKQILSGCGADAVLGGGGYVAGPVGLAASRLGIPLVLTEADSHLGLTNRLLASRARSVCLAFPIEGREGEPYLVTGRPVDAAIGHADRDAARARFGIAPGAVTVLVFGGSLGALSVNRAALDAFAGDVPAGLHILHISGKRDYEMCRKQLEAAGTERYTLLEFEPGLAEPLAAGDLVLARSGGSIFEVAAAGRPAILVPYPHATADHQTANASWMAEAGAAVIVPDAELTPQRLREQVRELTSDPGRLSVMSRASLGLARPDAAEDIAAQVINATIERMGRR